MTDQPNEHTKVLRLGARCMKKCSAADWQTIPPSKNGGVGTMRCRFDIPTATYDVISYPLYVCFVVKKRAKGDEVLDHWAEMHAAALSVNNEVLASLRWPASLEETLEWGRMVAALHAAERPAEWRTYA